MIDVLRLCPLQPCHTVPCARAQPPTPSPMGHCCPACCLCLLQPHGPRTCAPGASAALPADSLHVCAAPALPADSLHVCAAPALAADAAPPCCRACRQAYHNLQPRIVKQLLKALVEPQRPLPTLYGAIVGLAAQGHQVVRQVLVAQVGGAEGCGCSVVTSGACMYACMHVSMCDLVQGHDSLGLDACCA
jgi:hypothetical protein